MKMALCCYHIRQNCFDLYHIFISFHIIFINGKTNAHSWYILA